jgi:signal transduction histidine kinase
LDKGWSARYPCIWSAPFANCGVMQFGYTEERELLPREIEMLSAAGERCQSAAKKTRLLEDIALREEQLRKLAIRMLMVEENERRRISRELHDDAGQSLVVIRLQMEMIEQALPEGTEERERLAEARDITEKTILDLRRLIGDLSPAVLEQLGLGAALRQLAHRFRERYRSHVRLHVGHLPAMDSNFQLVIYRLAQECFSNIAEHSEAGTVNISLTAADRVLRLNVEDDGVGFDVESALDRKDCFGLVGIRERVAVLGGSVSITSTRKVGEKRATRKKTGTVIEIELPIP